MHKMYIFRGKCILIHPIGFPSTDNGFQQQLSVVVCVYGCKILNYRHIYQST